MQVVDEAPKPMAFGPIHGQEEATEALKGFRGGLDGHGALPSLLKDLFIDFSQIA